MKYARYGFTPILTINSTLLLEPPVTSELVDGPTYRIKFNSDSEIAELIIKADSVINEKFVRETKKILQEARPGHKYYLLVGVFPGYKTG
jgi:hypothetical protein